MQAYPRFHYIIFKYTNIHHPNSKKMATRRAKTSILSMIMRTVTARNYGRKTYLNDINRQCLMPWNKLICSQKNLWAINQQITAFTMYIIKTFTPKCGNYLSFNYNIKTFKLSLYISFIQYRINSHTRVHLFLQLKLFCLLRWRFSYKVI